MSPNRSSRRTFLRQSAGVAAIGLLPGGISTLPAHASARTAQQATPSKSAGKSIRLGGPVFNAPEDPEGLALAHRKLGYRAAYCPAVGLDNRDRIRDIVTAFAKHDVVIAEVGAWCNLLDSDAAKRAANLQTVTDGLALAEAVGARCCVDIAGSFNTTVWYGPHPENLSPRFFDAAVENARKIIDAVKPQRTKFCYEMMGWALPDCPDAYVKMIKAVDRPAFGVHLDPCNAVNSPDKFYHNTDLLNECFAKLGPWITSCHAKDLTWDVEMNVHFREVCLGTGSLDYATYLKCLAALPGEAPLMIEHMRDAEEYDKSRRHVLELGEKVGLSFS
jgi:sugar phosphate isomerase/epimerase